MKKIMFAISIVIAASFAITAQVAPNKPAIEYDSLMNMRFYEETGGFLVEPAGSLPASERFAGDVCDHKAERRLDRQRSAPS